MPMLMIQQPQFYWWPVTYQGTSDGDTIVSHSLVKNTIWAYGGDDWVWGNDAVDVVFAGAGNDQVTTYGGNDDILGEYGDDTIDAGSGNDQIQGNEGNDILLGGLGDDQIQGNEGHDLILGGYGDDTITGGSGNDEIHGGPGHDQVSGDAGDDRIWVGDDGFSVAVGGDGNDEIHGGDFGNILMGDAGDDTIWGGVGNDQIWAGSGGDHLYGLGGDDSFLLGSGKTVADGGYGNDTFALNYSDIDSPFALNGGDGKDALVILESAVPNPGAGGSNMLYAPADLVLSDLAARVDSVEVLSFNMQSSKLDLHMKPADVLDFTETGVLQIDANDPVTLHLEGGWSKGAPEMVGNVLHTDYVAAVGDHLVKVVVTAPHVDVA